MILNRFLMLMRILQSIWVQRCIPTKQIFHTVIQSKFNELVRNFDKNVIWNNLHIFLFRIQNWNFLAQQLKVTFFKNKCQILWMFSQITSQIQWLILKVIRDTQLKNTPTSTSVMVKRLEMPNKPDKLMWKPTMVAKYRTKVCSKMCTWGWWKLAASLRQYENEVAAWWLIKRKWTSKKD